MNTPLSALLERKATAIHSVSPDVSVAEAVAEMNRHRVGSIVVLAGGRLAGIFTERDVLKRVVGAGVDPNATKVSAVMTSALVTVRPETTVGEAMDLFTNRRCRHLPVLQHEQLVGLISIGDVSRYMADVHRTECEHLKSYISGAL